MTDSSTTTIHDVAKLAGVSIATVSRVLNAPGKVNPDTTMRVQQAMASLNYTRNMSARNLKTHTTKTIGILVPEMINTFFLGIVERVENLMYRHGYSIILCSSNDSLEQENEKLRLLLDKNVDAMIVIPVSDVTEHFTAVKKAGIPLIAVDRPLGGVEADTVTVNSLLGAQLVTSCLIKDGYERIGFIGGNTRVQTATDRYMGYLAAFREAGLPLDQSSVLFGGMTQDVGHALMREALSRPDHPNAFFCVNDMVHIGATSYLLEEATISQQSKIVFASFDYMYYGPLLKNCRYAAVQPMEEIGKSIVDMLLMRLSGDKSSFPMKIVLDPSIKALKGSG